MKDDRARLKKCGMFNISDKREGLEKSATCITQAS